MRFARYAAMRASVCLAHDLGIQPMDSSGAVNAIAGERTVSQENQRSVVADSNEPIGIAKRVAMVMPVQILAISMASAQTVIPGGTDIGGFLIGSTAGVPNWSATSYTFQLGGNTTWNTSTSFNNVGQTELQIDGQGNTVTRSIGGVFNLNGLTRDGSSITLSNLTFTQTANSPSGIFRDIGGRHTTAIGLYNVTFSGLAGAYGNVFYMSGTTGQTEMVVTAGTGTNGATFQNNTSTGDGGGVISLYGGTMTFNGDYTFDSNTTTNYGGAIAMYQNTGVLTFNGSTTFRNNRATTYFGGAIDVWGGASTLTFNSPSSFTGNYVVSSATGAGNPRGGAINIGYTSPGSGASIVRFNNTAIFDGNYVVSTGTGGSAYGGALSAYGNGNTYNYQYIFTAPALFQNNYVLKAGGGAGSANGGAIYYDASGATLSFISGTLFRNNAASSNGGAIYLQSGTINLIASTGNIRFQGNRQGVQFDASYRPLAGTGTPNAIYLGTSGALNLNAGSGQTIDFFDPIASAAGSLVTVTKSGDGSVVFHGDNGATGLYSSDVRANTTVTGGTFALDSGASYGASGTGTFTLGAATLRGGQGSTLSAGTLNLSGASTIGISGGLFTVATGSFNTQDGTQIVGNGTLTTTAGITLTGTTHVTVDNGSALTITAPLGGTGGFDLAGGTLTLSGTGSSYGGATAIGSGSTLVTAAANALGNSSSVTVDGSLDMSQYNYAQQAANLSGSGSIALGTATLTANNTADSTFAGSIAGTGALVKTGTGALTLSNASTYTGGTTVSSGTLIGNSMSAFGTGGIVNNGTLRLDFSNDETITSLMGTGALIKNGNGRLSSSTNVTQGDVSINGGELYLDNTAVLTAASYTTASGATTTVTDESQLRVTNALTQATGSTLNFILGDPSISAGSASLGGTLNVLGISPRVPRTATALTGSAFTVMHTTGGITGDFTQVGFGSTVIDFDYLQLAGARSANGLDYNISLALSWNSGTTLGHGTFTLPNATDSFNADVVLADQQASATGWNGRDLTKNGAGTLTLSEQNTYTGATTVNAGTLSMGAANAIANSTAVNIGSGATLALNDFSQTVNNLTGAGTVNLGTAAATAMTASNSTDTTFSGTITGAGNLVKTGTGTLTLSGTNTYTGGTTISDGTLIGYDIGAFGTGAIANNATLQLDFASDNTVNNALSGTGSLIKNGAGTITLTSGGTQGDVSLNGGGIRLAGSTTLGAANYTAGANTLTTVGDSAQLNVSGTYSQATDATLQLILGNPYVAAGNASIDGALEIIGFAPNTPRSASALTSTQFTVLHTTGGITGDFSSISFSGLVSQLDFLLPTGERSANNLDYNIGLGLTWRAGTTLGNGIFTLANATDSFNADVVLADQQASATGWNGRDLTKNGAGTLTLSAQNTYTGATTVNAGTLSMGAANAIASSTAVNIGSGATLALNDFSQTVNNLTGAGTVNLGTAAATAMTASNSTDTTFSGTITGAGALVKAGNGALRLAGANHYTGGTTITAGTLIGTSESFGPADVLNNATFVIDQPTAATMAQAINGTGSLIKTGAGMLNLTGNSNLSGPTTLAGGRLAVNGFLGNSTLSLAAGTWLQGNGTVGTLHNDGGTVTPGNSIGTLHVNGNYTQGAGAGYIAEIDPSTSATGDSIQVNGTATLAPGATLTPPRTALRGFSLNAAYLILSTTGGVNGKFTLTDDGHGSFYLLQDEYDGNNVYLKTRQYRTFASAAKTPNQIATANGLQSLPGSSTLRDAVGRLNSDDEARAAFDMLSGEIHASLKSTLLTDTRYLRDSAIDRLRRSQCLPGASEAVGTMPDVQTQRPSTARCEAPSDGFQVWARTFGTHDSISTDGNAAKMTQNLFGFLAGADSEVAPGWRAGALAGYSHGRVNVNDRNSNAQTDNFHLGAYGGTSFGNIGARVGASASWHSIDTERTPTFTDFRDKLESQYSARTLQAFTDVGYRFALDNLALEPFANAAFANLHGNGFNEGGSPAALSAGSSNDNLTFTTLGIRSAASLETITGTKMTFSMMAGWQHTFGSDFPLQTMRFAGGDPFTVAGVPIARNAALVEAGVSLQVGANTSVGLSYSGRYGGGASSETIQGMFSMRF